MVKNTANIAAVLLTGLRINFDFSAASCMELTRASTQFQDNSGCHTEKARFFDHNH